MQEMLLLLEGPYPYKWFYPLSTKASRSYCGIQMFEAGHNKELFKRKHVYLRKRVQYCKMHLRNQTKGSYTAKQQKLRHHNWGVSFTRKLYAINVGRMDMIGINKIFSGIGGLVHLFPPLFF
jgi:hypothetical protein